MVKDDQEPRTPRQSAEGSLFKLTALGLTLVGAAAATGFFLYPRAQQPIANEAQAQQPAGPPPLFRNWPRPDVALVFSAEEHGYLQPCGCSEPQKGGLARRYNFLKGLRQDRGWYVVAGDLGDIAQRSGPEALIKYKYAMMGLQRMDYTAVGIGENETALPLIDGLSEFALNNPSPRVVVANLIEGKNGPPFRSGGMVASGQVAVGKGQEPRVGFVGVVGPTVAKKVKDPDVHFDAPEKALPAALQSVQGQQPDLLVLFYMGTLDEAKECAQKFPQFQVIVYSSGEEEEPSSRPEQAGNTVLVSIGHKGRYVGVIGANRTGNAQQPWELRYQLVALDPEYETPQGQDNTNPIHALMQQFADEVKRDNYLARFTQNPARHPVQVAFPNSHYVGSERCKSCHKSAYKVWSESPHPHAYETLTTKAKRPTLRQYDGECVVCHVTGFGYKTGFTNEQATPKLRGVSCESCHGPAGEHARNPNDKQLWAALNPWKAGPGANPKILYNRISDMCQKCHDVDNDVHFKFEEYWEPKHIAHPTPQKERQDHGTE
jgi:hypothetical protein